MPELPKWRALITLQEIKGEIKGSVKKGKVISPIRAESLKDALEQVERLLEAPITIKR